MRARDGACVGACLLFSLCLCRFSPTLDSHHVAIWLSVSPYTSTLKYEDWMVQCYTAPLEWMDAIGLGASLPLFSICCSRNFSGVRHLRSRRGLVVSHILSYSLMSKQRSLAQVALPVYPGPGVEEKGEIVNCLLLHPYHGLNAILCITFLI